MPELLTRRETPQSVVGRLAGFKSEWWPTSIRNDGRLPVGISGRLQSESARYIQMLFEEAGTTFSEFALEQRLDAARSMLTSPRYSTWSITAIALEAGFGDVSHFNRRFNRRYLMTPSDLRRLPRVVLD